MNGHQPSISPGNLDARLGMAAAPVVIDVRHPADFARAEALILSATYHSPDDVERLRTVAPARLYTWCRSLQAETHDWPAKAVA